LITKYLNSPDDPEKFYLELFKGLECLSNMAVRQDLRKLIIKYKIYNYVINSFMRDEPHISRESACVLGKLLLSPSGLLLWLRFDSGKIELDHSMTTFAYKKGHPHAKPFAEDDLILMPALFDEGDSIEIPAPVEVETYSISFWFYYVPIKFPFYHTVFQSNANNGGITFMPDFSELLMFDEVTGEC